MLTVAVVAAGVVGYRSTAPDRQLRLEITTAAVGSGITRGTQVEMYGVPVGELDAARHTSPGRQRLTLLLDADAVGDLTDTLTLAFAPTNLFGVSRIAVRPGDGGTRLYDGATVDLTGAGRTVDVTMGHLLEQLSGLAGAVLTPQLSASLSRLSVELDAVAPVLHAVVATARTVADTQRYTPSYLIDRYAAAMTGVPAFLDGSMALLNEITHIPAIRTDSADFDRRVDVLIDELFPTLTRFGHSARESLGPYADLLTPILRAVAATVPDPNRSGAELRELLDRLGRAFTDGPDGPALDVEVVLRGVPAVAVPLASAIGTGGGR
ncbi:hypothetical protein IU501_04950 [Nocardia otitidiscaviarum]|uniref:hypothetical protein n=1 Tax=Nocardia otitidiscaviarum TaxID=1823 RepID=UPI000694317C|nr:hypothetical protein [Nocardia otitidiscaviarum]MBF6132342.1 hypothetical protein [Nocardia otitidiscaviarum]MBF6483434.1 hypothetical protein [Nocardia otitidiscaviarum]